MGAGFEGEGRAAQPPPAARRLVAGLALFFAVVAVVSDPGAWWETWLLAIPVVLFAAWVSRPAVLPVLGVAGPMAVAIACSGGGLEPGFFLMSLLAMVAVAWPEHRWVPPVVVPLCLLSPLAAAVLAPEEDILWQTWILGIGFPAAIGGIIRRLERVTAELTRARQELAERAVIDERRRVGRDVHDLVGHGLAAVMLHITGARHVLRRDPEAADDALRTAEEVGRSSMRELGRTVAMLRSDPAAADRHPPPQLRELARTYSAGGLRVDYSESGDLAAAPPTQVLTAYRIGQQALSNAAQHAPGGRTVVRLQVTAEALVLDVDSTGSAGNAAAAGPGRGHGLASMRERARLAGGELWAGPTAEGWSVRCELPIGGSAVR